ncbi:MAG: ATP-binding protein [Muribaculaceae bacterium]|nr:ATP-binding protein [Muribaculaceae bacterium]
MDNYIYRDLSEPILYAHMFYPVVMVTGARQVGKSTLCRHLFPDYKYVNLEDNETLLKAESEPKLFLRSLGSVAIIDEIQRCEKLFSQIQVEVDADPELHYVLTGSSDFTLMKNASQSLAGRIAVFTLPPLTFHELKPSLKDISTEELYFRGFYPAVLTGKKPPELFYRNYYSTYIEKDIRRQIKIENLSKFDIFMRLMAGRIGAEFNATSISAETGVSSKTITEWCSILEASYIIFALRPYFANISKRLSKMPKIYFYDVGLATYLLGIENSTQLVSHPLKGVLFENMAVAELMNRRLNQGKDSNLNFYRERNGKEIDILQSTPEGLKAYEVKSSLSFHPEFFKNLEYLKTVLPVPPISSTVIYDGESFPPLAENIRNF